jgi:hypothetical protein
MGLFAKSGSRLGGLVTDSPSAYGHWAETLREIADRRYQSEADICFLSEFSESVRCAATMLFHLH